MQPDQIETISDFLVISSFSAGSYSETRRSLTELKDARMMTGDPVLNTMLKALMTPDRLDWWIGWWTGVNAPAYAVTEMGWRRARVRLLQPLRRPARWMAERSYEPPDAGTVVARVALGSALVDRARLIRKSRSRSRCEGRTASRRSTGAWFRRRLEVPQRPSTAEPSGGRTRTAESPTIMYAVKDGDGQLVVLTGQDRVEVDSPQLGRAIYRRRR